jgi:hypothetical protein
MTSSVGWRQALESAVMMAAAANVALGISDL